MQVFFHTAQRFTDDAALGESQYDVVSQARTTCRHVVGGCRVRSAEATQNA